ncbi:hypothetical protein L7F22_036359 [Adiantum nelumboides]|nr:hypothetical protein [Adiantum nelumboides]
MADNLRERLASLSGKLKVGGEEVSKKVSTSMVTVGDKMKELFRVSTPTDKLIEELTSEDPLLPRAGLDWAKIMEMCDSIRCREVSSQEVVKALKKRLMVKANNSNVSLDTYTCSRIQLLTLTLIEACVKNCEHLFVDVANEYLLDEMVKIVDDPSTSIVARDKALKLIEAWGESTPELRNLPMFEETYKSLKSRGVKFPLRDPESLAPIFTPPESVAQNEKVHKPRRTYREILGDTQDGLAHPPTEELIYTARNSVDLLSTVLTSSPQQEALQWYQSTADFSSTGSSIQFFSAAPMASGERQSNPSTFGDAGGDHNEDYGDGTCLRSGRQPQPQPLRKKQYSEKELEEEVEARLARILGAQDKGKKHDKKRRKSTDFLGYLGSQSTFNKAKKHKKRVRFAEVPSSSSSSSFDSSSDSSEEDRKGKKRSKEQHRKGKKKARKSKSRRVDDSSTEDTSTDSSNSKDGHFYANKKNFYKANQYDFLENKSKKVREARSRTFEESSIWPPGISEDELTITLVEQCHRSQFMIQRIVEQLNDNEALLFEALNLNDELQKVLAKYEEMRASVVAENAPAAGLSASLQTEDITSL